MNYITVILTACLMLQACNDDYDFIGSDWVTISSSGTTTTIDENKSFNLTISGSNNDVTIESGNTIGTSSISGNNNLVTIKANTSVDKISISGSDNTVYVTSGSGITFNDHGYGNSLIVQ